MNDTSLITSSDRQHGAWTRFLASIGGKALTAEATHQAWHWFRSGWDAFETKLQGEATDWWCDYNG